jgi:hypothetical protein
MTSGKRKGLFWGSVGAFLVLGIYLTLTGLGLALDWQELKLVPTGSIYLRFSEKPNQVTLNGKERSYTSSWFESDLLFRSLLPENYLVVAEKEGFVTWSKSAPVPAGGVLARNNIRFFPATPSSTLMATGTESFWILGEELILKKSGALEFRQKTIRGKEVAAQSPDDKEIIVTDKNKKSFLINLDEPEAATNLELWFADLIGAETAGQQKNFSFHPFSSNKLLVTTNQGIFLADEKKNSLEKISNLSALASNANDSGLAATDGEVLEVTKFLFGANWSASTTLHLTDLKLSPKAEFVAAGDNQDRLWVFKNSTSTPELVESKIQEFSWSPEGDRLLFLSRNLIHLLYLDKWEEDFRKEAGDRLTLAPDHEGRIHNLSWLDNNHLIGLWGTELRIVEVDELLPLNSVVLAEEVKNYNLFSNYIFYLSTTGELHRLELE